VSVPVLTKASSAKQTCTGWKLGPWTAAWGLNDQFLQRLPAKDFPDSEPDTGHTKSFSKLGPRGHLSSSGRTSGRRVRVLTWRAFSMLTTVASVGKRKVKAALWGEAGTRSRPSEEGYS
jgi:hypothetical protein